MDTSGSENETRLVAGRPGGQLVWLPQLCWMVGPATRENRLSHIINAELEVAGGDDLLLVPDLNCEGASAVRDQAPGRGHRRGAQELEDSATAHPDHGGAQESRWELVWRLLSQIMFAK